MSAPHVFAVGEIARNLPERYAFQDVPAEARLKQMEWGGSFGEVIDELRPLLEERKLADNFWVPARAAFAATLCHTNGVRGDDRLEFIHDITKLGLQAYGGLDPDTAALRRVEETARRHGMRRNFIYQDEDKATLLGTDPQRTGLLKDGVARRLLDQIDGEPSLVLALLQGGLVTTYESVLDCMREEHELDMLVYPLPYSETKAHQRRLSLQPEEVQLLGRASGERTLVVVDDDAYTGATMEHSIQHLSNYCESSEIIGIASHDNRPQYVRNVQGEWWENSEVSL